ncbi:DEAD/DEAH box helicase [Corynebacterium tapiri]|uniref:DEAD/DEAH box helicase n=1 Tax=Corynebacterium tapiri TaxID=1448266 RepID=A0A5C4U7A3_9CORY|nr:DEAD/DEAH box helicase [Corynebacterium tapiri]TNL99381.1 DEAD/DEAH box helicase [Corynebacterium tapiri]
MAAISDVLDQLNEVTNDATRGYMFEKLMLNYFRVDPVLSQEYSEVYRFNEWPHNGGKTDTGIDLVARSSEDDSWVAIQCKFYKPTAYLQKQNLDSFFEASGRTFTTDKGTEGFSHRVIISTTDKWSKNAESMLENQQIPVSRIGISAIADSRVNWDVAFPGSEISIDLSLKETFAPRPHQQEAIDKTIEAFGTHDRGKLVMACGTGKTFTSLRLAETYAEQLGGRARVLFLVPSISLLSQTLKEWTAQANLDLKPFAVCSDTKVSKAAEDIAAYDLEVPVTTNGKHLAERMEHGKRAAGLNVVFSTYQSIQAIHDAQANGAPDFDLIICDEAHRTTGVTLAGEDPSNFTRVHDEDYIKAGKRLYMTATPRLFDDTTKAKATEHSAEIASMDDESTYGPEFHRLGFGEAVERGLLTDYKVVVMTVDESTAADAMTRMNSADNEVTLDLASAMIGTWNALAKRSGNEQDTASGFSSNETAMKRAVAFAKDIKTSKKIAAAFPSLIDSFSYGLKEKAATNTDVSLHNVDLAVQAEHVDGGMNALERGKLLTWLKATPEEDSTKILTNARCLSEGVDVPALDAIAFFNPRNSMVDVVQSVGRVMRKAKDKNYGYIILPVAVPPNTPPSQALNDNRRFKVVWQILNALRAHDDRFNAMVNSISLNEQEKDPQDKDNASGNSLRDKLAVEHVGETSDEPAVTSEQLGLFSLDQWQEAMYTKLVDKVGTRTYWEDWADDVADIAQAQIARITALIDDASPALRKEFERFITGLRANLNDSISEPEAISMLSQHLITAPVFDALFSEHDFASHNPVAQVMTRMVNALADKRLETETDGLEKFYQSVRVRASEVTSASGKQEVIKELYERFFRKAFKKQSEALGIVYTPVEVVDFILRAADEVSRKHFGKGLTDEGVHILDPFTGTGTFMVRLLQSGLISPEDLARKYATELHATEIMLLAYYVAAVNIETTYHAIVSERAQRDGAEEPGYEPFEGIALADTFQVHEEDDALDLDMFVDNNERIQRQKDAPIHVIVGNPPYSSGQNSANDMNANLNYPTLDGRISDTYAKNSTAKAKIKLYDSYLRAFRWATDRVGDKGIVAFVSNGGWIDGNSGDGVRLSFQKDFSDLYVFNLRGNARTSGMQRRKEAGNVFRDGGRTTIAITIGIKNPSDHENRIYYKDIGDYLSAEEKLEIVNRATPSNLDWEEIIPNSHGDWISQRSEDFGTWPALGKNPIGSVNFFKTSATGLSTNRDSWVYNFSNETLIKSIDTFVKTFNEAVSKLEKEKSINEFLKQEPELVDPTKIKWSSNLINRLQNRSEIQIPDSEQIIPALYRPFTTPKVIFHPVFNDRMSQLPRMFPSVAHQNIGFVVVSPGETVGGDALATNLVPDLHTIASSQFFPRFTWEKFEADDGELFGTGVVEKQPSEHSIYGEIGEVVDGYVRTDNITDEIKTLYREALGEDVTGDDIFHYVYGQLHDPEYREKYKADLKKMLPHIEPETDRARFDRVAAAGKKLMDLHVNYEDVEPYPLDVQLKESADPEDRETWRVIKLKWTKKVDEETGKKVNDVTTMIYNPKVTIAGIPEEADRYMLGSRSALAWIIDRYQVKTDKKSGIVNDPNDWADEVGNPRYIVDLIGKVTRVAVETVKIIDDLG